MRCIFLFMLLICIDVLGKIQLHQLFLIADKDKKAALELISSTEKSKSQSNLMMAYYGAAKMMMANHVFNPYQKLSYFNEGKYILEKAIATENDNIELRFIRYSIQLYAPSFLGYRSNLKNDKDFLSQNLQKEQDSDLKKTIIILLSKHK